MNGGRSSLEASYTDLSGEGCRCLRVAVLVALPRAEQATAVRPATPPPLCLGLVDT